MDADPFSRENCIAHGLLPQPLAERGVAQEFYLLLDGTPNDWDYRTPCLVVRRHHDGQMRPYLFTSTALFFLKNVTDLDKLLALYRIITAREAPPQIEYCAACNATGRKDMLTGEWCGVCFGNGYLTEKKEALA